MDPKNRDYFPFNHADLKRVDGDVAVCPCKYSSGRSHLCGYVDIPKDQIPAPWNDFVPDELEETAHGGITYITRHARSWVFGFDCGHAGDDDRPELSDPDHVLELALRFFREIAAAGGRDDWMGEWVDG